MGISVKLGATKTDGDAAPQFCVEYVAIHELCHLVYPNHSKDFYSLLSFYLPDHRERKKLLSKGRISIEDVRKKYGM